MVNNATRAEWAAAALKAFSDPKMQGLGYPAETVSTRIGDLLTDLMHLCHQQGLDWTALVERAEGHFEAELEEETDE